MAALGYWLWLTSLRHLPAGAAFRVLEHFGTPEGAYFADPAEYALVEGLPSVAQSALLDKSLDRAQEILADCDRLGVWLLTLQDAQYPERLRQLPDPPPVLYGKGRRFHFDEEAAVAVVGARSATPYGLKTARRLGGELARQGGLVVSGIAQGVDSAALEGALRAGGGVVSVLGNGVDVVYPHTNRALYEDVAAAGVLLSEYPPGTGPNSRHFPVRNRIISGLSLGVTVVEGSEISGSLITARLALDQNRDVFAIPGNVDAPLSRGPNLLIRRGEARLIQNAWDILEEYEVLYPGKIRRADVAAASEEPFSPVQSRVSRKDSFPVREKTVDNEDRRSYIDLKEAGAELTDDEGDILRALAQRPMGTDDLIEATQIPARRVLSALTVLQIRGFLEEQPGRLFRALVRFKAD